MSSRQTEAIVGVTFALLAVLLLAVARLPEVVHYQGVYSFYALAFTFVAGAGWVLLKLFPKTRTAAEVLLEYLTATLLRAAFGTALILTILLAIANIFLKFIFGW